MSLVRIPSPCPLSIRLAALSRRRSGWGEGVRRTGEGFAFSILEFISPSDLTGDKSCFHKEVTKAPEMGMSGQCGSLKFKSY